MARVVGLVALVLGLAAVTVALSIWEWGQLGDTGMSAAGYGALVAGAVVAMIVGSGLMGLIFYSSRRGYDEAPELKNDSDLSRDAIAKL